MNFSPDILKSACVSVELCGVTAAENCCRKGEGMLATEMMMMTMGETVVVKQLSSVENQKFTDIVFVHLLQAQTKQLR